MQAINCSSFAFLESRLSSAFVCFLWGASSGIYAAAILHNIALWAYEELDERDILVELLDDNDPIDHAALDPNYLNLGRAARDNYVRANIG
jgi:hypothetical protein